MSSVKLSQLPDFQGKRLLLEAQRRGVELVGTYLDGTTTTLIGLANPLVEQHIFAENEPRKTDQLEKPL